MNHKTDMQAAFDAYYAENWPLCKASIEKGTASEEIVGEREALWDTWQDAWKAALASQSAGVAEGITEKQIADAIKQWFPDRAYQAPFFARSLFAAAPAPVSAPAPDREQATLCEDGGKCGIGGYCGQCEKVRAASEPEQPKQSVPAPLSEYHEDTGPVVWWTWQDGLWLGEPAWIGAPTDSDWPGYHTHWTYHPEFPLPPLAVAAKLNEAPRRVTCSLTHEQISALYLHLLRRPRPEFGWMEAPLVAIESALMPVHGAIHDRGFNAMNRQFFGDDRFKFEERNIPPNIEPAEQPSEHGEQDCPHGVDDGACKQCYGEAVRGKQGTALLHAAADECMSPDQRNLFDSLGAHDADVYERLFRCVAKRIDASAPTLSGGDVGHALIERLRKTMVRLGVFPGEGLEWFAANLESYLYSLDRAVNKMLDAVVLSQPQAAEPKGLTGGVTVPRVLLQELAGDVEDYSVSREFKPSETAWRADLLARARSLLTKGE